MGYDLHIKRADNWTENAGAEIGAEEWLAVVRADPELTLDTANGPYVARCSGPSRYPDPWLDWFAGHVYTKIPVSALLRKMVALADRLGARVQGDDGDFYDGSEPLDDYHAAAERRRRPGRVGFFVVTAAARRVKRRPLANRRLHRSAAAERCSTGTFHEDRAAGAGEHRR